MRARAQQLRGYSRIREARKERPKYRMSLPFSLSQGDCFDYLPTLPDNSVHLILTDTPFGDGGTGKGKRAAKTACDWDRAPDLEKLWAEFRRILTPIGTVIMFGVQPFTSRLVLSNPAWHRYNLVWRKSRPTNFQHCKTAPLRDFEDVVIFSPAGCHNRSGMKMTYHPQGLIELEEPRLHRPSERKSSAHLRQKKLKGGVQTHTNHPRSILEFASVKHPVHPTQKPARLCEYLIRTYSNEGETVLDCFSGSGTTGEAAALAGRKFTGCELDPDYYAYARKRIEAAYSSHTP